MKKILALTFALLVMVAAWWIITPNTTFRSLRSAAQAGDREAIDKRVDFASVRSNLKADIRTLLMERVRQRGNDPLAAFGVLVGGRVVDRLVDTFVSPGGIATLAHGHVPEEDNSTRDRPAQDYRIDRSGLNKFTVRFKDSDTVTPGLVFRRRGLHWEMTRVELGRAR